MKLLRLILSFSFLGIATKTIFILIEKNKSKSGYKFTPLFQGIKSSCPSVSALVK
ncbi:hypothetical protein EMA8858_03073 [Emticicia aquatica]|uniref:Uncharacterized protein n=1 Tax=Emticicia aquatica TaxID=1681835 RepID=A0ABM9ATF1_9BACT|nr:hypothetical protein EMA8858_03073 [Emticicia aquatica]